MSHRSRARAAGIALLLCAALACSLLGVRTSGSAEKSADDEERELGLQFDLALRKQVRVFEDPVVAGFINDLGQEIVRTIEPQPFVYRFRIIEADSLNAFAVPGGYVYFHSGTLLAVSSIDELAGIMGHEIAHVKGRHYARMRKQSQIPDILIGLAGMAAAVATREPGLVIASQAANMAIQLRFSREYENEADHLGSIFVSRAGFRPGAVTRFFDRIVAEEKKHPHELPPYLFSHPDVEDRIDSIEAEALSLKPTRAADPRFARELTEVQARLAYLLDTQRSSVPAAPRRPEAPPDPAIAETARRLEGAGRYDEAILAWTRAEGQDPSDPQIPFQIGELLARQQRHREAALAFRRTIALDPTRARVFYALGNSLEAVGDRHSAVQAYEQASRRSGAGSTLQQKAEWRIEMLIFPPWIESGLRLANDTGTSETTAATTATRFPAGTRQLIWWGRLDPRYETYARHLGVRWIDPGGRIASQGPIEAGRKLEFEAPLDPADTGSALASGNWRVEILYHEEVVARQTFSIQPSR